VYSWLRTQPTEQRDVRLDEVRTKLDEAVHDNRQLRMSLLDTQTSIALMRSELLQLRTMYEEKCRELSSERERILEVLQEQDHLSRQLNLLHDANKRLLDSHDVLRNNVESPGKQAHTNIYRCKSGSVIGDYLDPAHAYDITGRFQEDENGEDSESEAYRRPKSMDSTYACPIRRRPKPKDRQLAQQSLNHSDSGVSTVRDSGEVDENWDISPRHPVDSEDEYAEIDHVAVSRRERLRRDSGQSRASRPASMPPPASEKGPRLSSGFLFVFLTKALSLPLDSENRMLSQRSGFVRAASQQQPGFAASHRHAAKEEDIGHQETAGDRGQAGEVLLVPIDTISEKQS
ncbi:hypothetical protein AVEN_211783-1, partial [Araneus ventricosus]